MNRDGLASEPPAFRFRPGFLDRFLGFRAMRLDADDLPRGLAGDPMGEVRELGQALSAINAELVLVRSELEAARSAGSRRPEPATTAAPAGAAVVGRSELVELAVQVWRFARRAEGLDAERFPRERKQMDDSVRRFRRVIDLLGIEIVDPTGQPYSSGWVEVEVLSWEEPDPGTASARPTVKQCLAPIVRRQGQVLARGQVVVLEASDASDGPRPKES
jgi:hypothetical protein